MLLDEKNRDQFLTVYMALLTFVNNVYEIVPNVRSINDFIKLSMQNKLDIKEALYEDISVLDDFCDENPFQLSDIDLEIILEWKNYVKGNFIVYKQFKKYCVFLEAEESKEAYGVLGLTNSFEEILGFLPSYIETVLLPFKGKIVCDGLIHSHPVQLGANMRADIKEDYEFSKALFGIIEKLPFEPPTKNELNINLLKYYIKNDENMVLYKDEILDLLKGNKDYTKIYYTEIGKRHAKKMSKRLKEVGIQNRWFAIFNNVIVASGRTEAEAKENALTIIPSNKKDHFVLFKVN